jgi:hypothetical protein
MTQTPDLSAVTWRKASFSNTQGGNCVEVADLPDGMAVRDSKDPEGPILLFTLAEWRAFLEGAKHGEFER